MNAELKQLAEKIRETLDKLTDEERKDFLDSLPYCPFCGDHDARHSCQCMNDE